MYIVKNLLSFFISKLTSFYKKKLKFTQFRIIIGSCNVHPALLLGHPANSEVVKLPFRNSSFGIRFFWKHSGISFFRKLSRRRICDFRKYSETPSGRTSSGMFPEETSSGRYPFTFGRNVFRNLVFF